LEIIRALYFVRSHGLKIDGRNLSCGPEKKIYVDPEMLSNQKIWRV
jgi:hypothetical protein